MIFTTAAYDDVESISDVAFENVEQGILLSDFSQIAGLIQCLLGP